MSGPRVLVLTLSFGSGHVRAARAVAEAVETETPDATVRVVDALDGARAAFRAFYEVPYWLMIRHAPWLWARFFSARVARGDDATAPAWAFRWGCAHVFEVIRDFEPDVVVASEVAAVEMASIARRDGATRARVVGVVTDREAEPVWVKPEVDAYAVPDVEVASALVAWGAPRDRVSIVGIPTAAAFAPRDDADETRARFGAPEGSSLALLMGGGMGPTRIDEVAARVCASGEPVHVVAVAGRDARAHAGLASVRPSGRASIRVAAWTDAVAPLMRAADVLVTKPGGLTLAEASMSRVPVVMFGAIPGPEDRNAARVEAAGGGVRARSAAEAADVALDLLRDEARRARMAAANGALAAPDAARDIARLALEDMHRERRRRAS